MRRKKVNSDPQTVQWPSSRWQMPIDPSSYDQSPLTEEEWEAIQHCASRHLMSTRSRASDAARKMLARLDLPLVDVYHLRHHGKSTARIPAVLRIMHREMYRTGKVFWDWSPDDWVNALCSTPTQFGARHGNIACCHMSIMDAAYLLGNVTDLRSAGMWINVCETARAYFGKELIAQQCRKVIETLIAKGYKDGQSSLERIRRCLSMLFLLNRSPYLEDITEEHLAVISAENNVMRQTCQKIGVSLQHLETLPPPAPRGRTLVSHRFDHTGMAPQWYVCCMKWYEHAVDLSPDNRRSYLSHLLATGRWLQRHTPEVSLPQQWTEELALRFRADLCTWTNGQYGSERGRYLLESKGELGKPLGPKGIRSYLTALRRFFTDLARRPYEVEGGSAQRIVLDFVPGEVLATPVHIQQAIDVVNPRDIDLRVWAKLTIAAVIRQI
jgi:hypothetical protein